MICTTTFAPLLAAAIAITATTTTAFVTPTFTSSSSSRSSATSKLDLFKVFIDGEAGTTGLKVRQRLVNRNDLEIISPPDELRKDDATRKEFINKADAVIMCLPDAASIEAASWVENDNTVLIDASTAFRVDPEWTYGFPELGKAHREELEKSKRIANPGCYPTGFIALTRPLVDAGLLAEGTPLTVNAISGYSGGGKALMELFQKDDNQGGEPWSAYGLNLSHKHIPEMTKYSGLGVAPIFQPQIAHFEQGMVVNVPIHYSWFNKEGITGKDIHDVYMKHYDGSFFVRVMELGVEANEYQLSRGGFLRPDTLADSNRMQLFVFPNDDAQQVLLVARLDNLGKGASGAAVQNLNIALGIDETAGLS
uniref:Semialdehyde dehydrogenase NAD-binding domain-containing protein n=1 Tax=Grammatophora oceanica TaxID=210454 RepID=A0A6U5JSE4_9STRA|mmetsp:Transcript_26754/g.39103  ORF Transcript_26754/g.39103 Transcript_26754/m.39103 type:complete len:366 (+) Transcript_26754:112-1209(+)|eukprot:CAMPEP_0194048090 /NCGR_PEP_ID=MMETSP0009_2-20130614/26719_1 /TAXON_ID=210454 /ORGANISM="Grammatophora oceanica, Strain CCMP 410" /LENGTH=365 /DNA_ID=CAMNT_0038693897 /DNA_START=61 /DNA_END=1158 /DNA_ORIENTATION=+